MPLRFSRLVALLAFGSALASAPALAAPLPFQATLTISMGTLPPIVLTGSGLGSSAGNGGPATLPASVFATNFATPLTPPLVFFNGLALGSTAVPGPINVTSPTHAPAVLDALNWNGTTGTMPLHGSAFLLVNGIIGVRVPLTVVGVGGTAHPGGLIATIQGNPFQTGTVTVTGVFFGSPTAQTAVGYDARTPGGAGTLQLVSPTRVITGGLAAGNSLGVISTLAIQFVPEPATAALLALGTFGLALAGSRRSRRR